MANVIKAPPTFIIGSFPGVHSLVLISRRRLAHTHQASGVAVAVAVPWLADMMDPPPLSGRASLPLVPWDSASATFINRLQIIPNKTAEVPRLDRRDLEWHTLCKTWCITMPALSLDKKLLLTGGLRAWVFFACEVAHLSWKIGQLHYTSVWHGRLLMVRS